MLHHCWGVIADLYLSFPSNNVACFHSTFMTHDPWPMTHDPVPASSAGWFYLMCFQSKCSFFLNFLCFSAVFHHLCVELLSSTFICSVSQQLKHWSPHHNLPLSIFSVTCAFSWSGNNGSRSKATNNTKAVTSQTHWACCSSSLTQTFPFSVCDMKTEIHVYSWDAHKRKACSGRVYRTNCSDGVWVHVCALLHLCEDLDGFEG